MNPVVWKNYLEGQILYRSLVLPIKNGVNITFVDLFFGMFNLIFPDIPRMQIFQQFAAHNPVILINYF